MKKTIKQLRSGKSMLGKDGAFAPLLKEILEASLMGEMLPRVLHKRRVDRAKLPFFRES